MSRKSTGIEKIKLLPNLALARVADKHLTLFNIRVSKKGKDARGNIFKSYTKKYADLKVSGMVGKSGKRLSRYKGIGLDRQVDPPNFILRGLTMKDLKRREVKKHSYILGFDGEYADIVKGNKQRGRDIYTSIPQSESDKIAMLIKKEIDAEAKIKLKNVKIKV